MDTCVIDGAQTNKRCWFCGIPVCEKDSFSFMGKHACRWPVDGCIEERERYIEKKAAEGKVCPECRSQGIGVEGNFATCTQLGCGHTWQIGRAAVSRLPTR